ncbi:MAG: HAD family hydrolase [Arhodomonas sp.]|nr:HAD family hydrolase [Arhodomonas sp.]
MTRRWWRWNRWRAWPYGISSAWARDRDEAAAAPGRGDPGGRVNAASASIPPGRRSAAFPGAACRWSRRTAGELTVGPDAALAEAGIDNPLSARGAELKVEGGTPLFVAVDGILAGAIGLSDPLRPEAADVVERVRALDLEVVLLSGDDALAVRAVADRLGIGVVRAGAEGWAKVNELRALREEERARRQWWAMGSTTPTPWRAPMWGSRSSGPIPRRPGAHR